MYFLDCEASSLNPASFPIEIAWVAESGQGETYLIRPEPHWTDWSAGAERIHKISYARLHREGLAAARVATRATSVLADQIIVSDNPAWDQHWLAVLLQTIGHPVLPVLALDRMLAEQMRRMTPLNPHDPQSAAWHRENKRLLDYGQSLLGAAQYEALMGQSVTHRALADAERMWRCWQRVKESIDRRLAK